MHGSHSFSYHLKAVKEWIRKIGEGFGKGQRRANSWKARGTVIKGTTSTDIQASSSIASKGPKYNRRCKLNDDVLNGSHTVWWGCGNWYAAQLALNLIMVLNHCDHGRSKHVFDIITEKASKGEPIRSSQIKIIRKKWREPTVLAKMGHIVFRSDRWRS